MLLESSRANRCDNANVIFNNQQAQTTSSTSTSTWALGGRDSTSWPTCTGRQRRAKRRTKETERRRISTTLKLVRSVRSRWEGQCSRELKIKEQKKRKKNEEREERDYPLRDVCRRGNFLQRRGEKKRRNEEIVEIVKKKKTKVFYVTSRMKDVAFCWTKRVHNLPSSRRNARFSSTMKHPLWPKFHDSPRSREKSFRSISHFYPPGRRKENETDVVAIRRCLSSHGQSSQVAHDPRRV